VWPIIGHEWAIDLLDHSIRNNRLGHAYLFVGPRQVGKHTLAKATAQALLCTGEDAPCGMCRACRLVAADRHPDVHLIAPDGSSIKIEAIREVQHAISLSAVEGRYRVVILDDFDRATTSASNALLKTLEEPPGGVVLLLVATRPESLLPTIVSRCQVLSLRLVPVERVVSALQVRGVEAGRAHLLGRLSQGRIGWALGAVEDEQALAERTTALDAVRSLARASYTERFSWAQSLSKKPERVPAVLEVMASWWRDVLLIASGSVAPIANVDHEDELQEWAIRHDTGAASAALQAIQDTAWRLEHNANLRLSLEVLALDLPGSR
jgi:DNA polymerase-3 subunit delta'